MTNRPDDDATTATPPPQSGAGADRRAFLRSLPKSAARTAEQLAGVSSIVRRSVIAAGDALIREVDPPPETSVPASTGQGVAAASPAAATVPPAPRVPAAAASLPDPVRDPVADLSEEQHAFLAGRASLVIAANDPAGPPHLTSSPYDWDGALFRLPGRLSSARAIAIDRDPRVSLLVDDPESGSWVAVTGRAVLAPMDRVEREIPEILAASLGAAAAATRWEEMRPMGDWIVIHVRPVRFVWRLS